MQQNIIDFIKLVFVKQIYILVGSFSLLLFSCNKSQVFKTVSPEHSGIHFNNLIIESDSINVLDFENIYNGGGVE